MDEARFAALEIHIVDQHDRVVDDDADEHHHTHDALHIDGRAREQQRRRERRAALRQSVH